MLSNEVAVGSKTGHDGALDTFSMGFLHREFVGVQKVGTNEMTG